MMRQATLLRFLAVFNFIVIAMGLQSAFTATGGNDANAVARLAEAGEFGAGGYGATALVYAIIPDALRQVFILGLGAWFIFFSLRRLQTNVHGLVMVFLALAPSILTISNFHKDLLLAPFVIAAAWALTRFPKGVFLIASIGLIYLSYGSLFRSYYFLILFFFLFVLAIRKLRLHLRVLLFLVLLLVLMNTPLSVLQTLQEPRDIVNYYRLNTAGAIGARTAFANLLPIDGAWSFTVNYVYALVRLNLAFVVDPGIREAFLQLNVALYFFAIFYGLRHGSRVGKNAASLLLAHVIVLTFFEPDLGSYIRHLSSTLPFAAIPLVEYFARHRWRVTWNSKSTDIRPTLASQGAVQFPTKAES
ncbi:hypothetical protein [Rhodovulum sp. FJ3]|uniref:hypothetical protein n=1 Tax=Rhodovulum sp. FJ3 TaxID=3079053 RepID=UPI00293DD080|nr:hypothetical protein [Rhodovulum sp. FJ3]MDV4166755.1 hypothetical protein [Rhodovulum sp. FJ3]